MFESSHVGDVVDRDTDDDGSVAPIPELEEFP